MWRLVTAKVATLEELTNFYTFHDMLKLTAVLDFQEDVKRIYMPKVEE